MKGIYWMNPHPLRYVLFLFQFIIQYPPVSFFMIGLIAYFTKFKYAMIYLVVYAIFAIMYSPTYILSVLVQLLGIIILGKRRNEI